MNQRSFSLLAGIIFTIIDVAGTFFIVLFRFYQGKQALAFFL